MKSPDLIQFKGLHKVELTLEEDGVSILERHLFGSRKTFLYFENTPPSFSDRAVISKPALTWAILFTIAAAAGLAFAAIKKVEIYVAAVAGAVAALSWVLFYISRKTLVGFSKNGFGLHFIKNKPSEPVVAEFIKKFFAARKICLLKKFGRFLDEESFELKLIRLNYLRTQELIDDLEFAAKREELSREAKK